MLQINLQNSNEGKKSLRVEGIQRFFWGIKLTSTINRLRDFISIYVFVT